MSEQSTQVFIGSTLRKSREVLGLDINQAAEAVHLDVSVIVALESDDFDSLPSRVFVQGYIRNYAKLLDIDERPILDAYNQYQPQLQKQKSPDLMKVKVTQYAPIMVIFNLIKWLVIIILSLWMGYALLTWMSHNTNAPVPLSSIFTQQDEEQITPQSASLIEQLLDTQSNLDDEGKLEKEVSDLIIQEQGESAEILAQPTPITLTQRGQSEGELLEQLTSSEQQPIRANENLSIESADAEKIAEAVEVIQTVIGVDQGDIDRFQLTLHFHQDSWLEILDEKLNRLAFGLYEMGSVKSITVKGRVNVFLGNSPSVEVRVDGVLQDQSDYGYGANLARFGVNKSGLMSNRF